MRQMVSSSQRAPLTLPCAQVVKRLPIPAPDSVASLSSESDCGQLMARFRSTEQAATLPRDSAAAAAGNSEVPAVSACDPAADAAAADAAGTAPATLPPTAQHTGSVAEASGADPASGGVEAMRGMEDADEGNLLESVRKLRAAYKARRDKRLRATAPPGARFRLCSSEYDESA